MKKKSIMICCLAVLLCATSNLAQATLKMDSGKIETIYKEILNADHDSGDGFGWEGTRGTESGKYYIRSLLVKETQASPVPEPVIMFLFGTGLVGLATVGRKRLIKN